jgi:hypothetical protein
MAKKKEAETTVTTSKTTKAPVPPPVANKKKIDVASINALQSTGGELGAEAQNRKNFLLGLKTPSSATTGGYCSCSCNVSCCCFIVVGLKKYVLSSLLHGFINVLNFCCCSNQYGLVVIFNVPSFHAYFRNIYTFDEENSSLSCLFSCHALICFNCKVAADK